MKEVNQAVILARGLGSRMRGKADDVGLSPEAAAVADRGVKALVPLNGRPFIDYLLNLLFESGISRTVLVVAPEAAELRERALWVESKLQGLDVGFAVQNEPLGTADAVLASEPATGGEPFMVLNGDNLYQSNTLRALRSTSDSNVLAAFDRATLIEKSNIVRERIDKFGVIVPTAEWTLERIIEKPPEPERYEFEGRLWLNMNLLRFSSRIYEACRSIEPDETRGE